MRGGGDDCFVSKGLTHPCGVLRVRCAGKSMERNCLQEFLGGESFAKEGGTAIGKKKRLFEIKKPPFGDSPEYNWRTEGRHGRRSRKKFSVSRTCSSEILVGLGEKGEKGMQTKTHIGRT